MSGVQPTHSIVPCSFAVRGADGGSCWCLSYTARSLSGLSAEMDSRGNHNGLGFSASDIRVSDPAAVVTPSTGSRASSKISGSSTSHAKCTSLDHSVRDTLILPRHKPAHDAGHITSPHQSEPTQHYPILSHF